MTPRLFVTSSPIFSLANSTTACQHEVHGKFCKTVEQPKSTTIIRGVLIPHNYIFMRTNMTGRVVHNEYICIVLNKLCTQRSTCKSCNEYSYKFQLDPICPKDNSCLEFDIALRRSLMLTRIISDIRFSYLTCQDLFLARNDAKTDVSFLGNRFRFRRNPVLRLQSREPS